MMFVPHKKHPYRPLLPVIEIGLLLYVDDVRTSQEIRLWAFMAYYKDRFIFLSRISTHLSGRAEDVHFYSGVSFAIFLDQTSKLLFVG
jgi:hypothetical protein